LTSYPLLIKYIALHNKAC